MKEIKIGASRYIGDGHDIFIAAEIGINHNGDMEMAHRMIDEAVKAGVDAVKFQNYITEDFILDKNITYTYSNAGDEITESQFEMFKRYELSVDKLNELKKHCDDKKIVFFSTPTGKKGVDDLVKIGAPLLKNGSDFLVDLELIEYMASTKLPTVISTGMSTVSEISDAVEAYKKAGGNDLILLHCTSTYPTPAEEVNISRINTLKLAFDVPVGFSDHTDGIVAAILSVNNGSCFIEKHFTLDKTLPGPDHRFSSTPDELKLLVKSIRQAQRMVGQALIEPTASEQSSRRSFRLSCVSVNDLPLNHVLTKADIVFMRPGTGLPPKMRNWIIGLKLTRQIKKGEIFTSNHFA